MLASKKRIYSGPFFKSGMILDPVHLLSIREDLLELLLYVLTKSGVDVWGVSNCEVDFSELNSGKVSLNAFSCVFDDLTPFTLDKSLSLSLDGVLENNMEEHVVVALSQDMEKRYRPAEVGPLKTLSVDSGHYLEKMDATGYLTTESQVRPGDHYIRVCKIKKSGNVFIELDFFPTPISAVGEYFGRDKVAKRVERYRSAFLYFNRNVSTLVRSSSMTFESMQKYTLLGILSDLYLKSFSLVTPRDIYSFFQSVNFHLYRLIYMDPMTVTAYDHKEWSSLIKKQLVHFDSMVTYIDNPLHYSIMSLSPDGGTATWVLSKASIFSIGDKNVLIFVTPKTMGGFLDDCMIFTDTNKEKVKDRRIIGASRYTVLPNRLKEMGVDVHVSDKLLYYVVEDDEYATLSNGAIINVKLPYDIKDSSFQDQKKSLKDIRIATLV